MVFFVTWSFALPQPNRRLIAKVPERREDCLRAVVTLNLQGTTAIVVVAPI
jgi:hypothetical protein